MHLPVFHPSRLISAAALACAAALIPAASLAATAAPAARAVTVTPARPGQASTPRCATSGLVVWLGPSSGYAGGVGYTLEFTNLSGHACTLDGNPGVSAVSLTGHQLGRPASWTNIPKHVVTLASGATATAVLLITDTGVFGDPSLPCDPVTAAGLRVYPPNQTASKVIPYPFSACSHAGPVYMSAEPVQKG